MKSIDILKVYQEQVRLNLTTKETKAMEKVLKEKCKSSFPS